MMWRFSCGLLIILAGLNSIVAVKLLQHPYDPHTPPSAPNKQWFEGWYTRVTLDQGWSMGIIVGSFPVNSFPDSSAGKYASLLLQSSADGKLEELEFNPRQLEIKRCHGPHRPCFNIEIYDPLINGSIKIRPSQQQYTLSMIRSDGVPCKVDLIIDDSQGPTPWGPNGDGPEGKVGILPLPLHWYVLSVRSKARLSIQHPSIQPSGLLGQVWHTGVAHMEKNWGGSFPSSWLWAQAISTPDAASISAITNETATVEFAMAGGDLGIADGILPQAYLIRWQGRESNFQFGPLDNLIKPLKVHGDYCGANQRSVNVQGWLPLKSITFTISIEAKPETFSVVQCPTNSGFKPYSAESFVAHAKISVFNTNGELIESAGLSNAALEFGGNWLEECHRISRFRFFTE